MHLFYDEHVLYFWIKSNSSIFREAKSQTLLRGVTCQKTEQERRRTDRL